MILNYARRAGKFRYKFEAFVTMSALIFLFAICLWKRSHTYSDRFMWRLSDSRAIFVESTIGGVQFVWETQTPPDLYDYETGWSVGQPLKSGAAESFLGIGLWNLQNHPVQFGSRISILSVSLANISDATIVLLSSIPVVVYLIRIILKKCQRRV